MSDVQAALDNFKQVFDNQQALADPEGMMRAAQLAWMQAVSDAITTGTGAVKVTTTEDGQVKVEAVRPVADGKVASMAELAAAVNASVAADASPSSTEPATIAPTTPSV